jgi:hypothetical protein
VVWVLLVLLLLAVVLQGQAGSCVIISTHT